MTTARSARFAKGLGAAGAVFALSLFAVPAFSASGEARVDAVATSAFQQKGKQDALPPGPGSQRATMIQLLRSIDQRLASIEEKLDKQSEGETTQ